MSESLRVKWIAGAAAIAALLALIQRTSVAPLPHGADGFLAGFAVGAGLATIIAWIGTRS